MKYLMIIVIGILISINFTHADTPLKPSPQWVILYDSDGRISINDDGDYDCIEVIEQHDDATWTSTFGEGC